MNFLLSLLHEQVCPVTDEKVEDDEAHLGEGHAELRELVSRELRVGP